MPSVDINSVYWGIGIQVFGEILTYHRRVHGFNFIYFYCFSYDTSLLMLQLWSKCTRNSDGTNRGSSVLKCILYDNLESI